MNNYAWDDMTKNGEAFAWLNDADKWDGADINKSEINKADFWKTTAEFSSDIWTLADKKLPGLNGKPVDMPKYLIFDGNSLPTIDPSNDKVVATEYYNLLGVKIAYPVKGNINIIKTTFESGKTSVVKQFIIK